MKFLLAQEKLQFMKEEAMLNGRTGAENLTNLNVGCLLLQTILMLYKD